MPVNAVLVTVLKFAVEYLLLLGVNRMTGFPAGGRRTAAAALLGGVYGGICLLPEFAFLRGGFWRLGSIAVIGGAAFGTGRSGWRRIGLFLLLSMAMGGLALSLRQSAWPSLLLAAGSVWLLGQGMLAGQEAQLVPLEVSYGGNALQLTALRDTGNTLRDPITGEHVLVLSAQAALALTGLTQEQLRRPLETLLRPPLPGLRLIPYRTVGIGQGFLLGLRLEEVRIGRRRKSMVAAFAPEGLDAEAEIQALTGGML